MAAAPGSPKAYRRPEDIPELCGGCRKILAEYGRLGGLEGGRARVNGMTLDQLSEHMKKMRSRRGYRQRTPVMPPRRARIRS